MELIEKYELYLIGVLALVLVLLIWHTIRYYRAKRRLFRYMRRFASEGDAQAGFYVAEAYRRGEIIPKNMKKAHFWYAKAAYAGSKEAKAYLETYVKKQKKKP